MNGHKEAGDAAWAMLSTALNGASKITLEI